MSLLMSQSNGDVAVVYFTQARILDQPVIEQLGEELLALATKHQGCKLLLNFQDVRFMGSAAIGKLMLLKKQCKAEDVKLKLCNVSKDLMEAFKLMRLDKILDIYADESRALAAFAKRGWFG